MIKRHINSMLECISRTKNSQTYPLLYPISRTWINAYRAWCIMMYLNLFKGSLISRCRFTIHKCVSTYSESVNMFTKFDRIDLCKSCKHALSLKKGSSDKAIIGHPVKNVFRRLIVFKVANTGCQFNKWYDFYY